MQRSFGKSHVRDYFHAKTILLVLTIDKLKYECGNKIIIIILYIKMKEKPKILLGYEVKNKGEMLEYRRFH